MKRLLQEIFAVAVLGLLFTFGPQVTQASAACRTQTIDSYHWINANPYQYFSETPGAKTYTWWYSDQMWVPYYPTSTCHDINIRNLHKGGTFDGQPGSTYFRVRFWPGGWTNGAWSYVSTALSTNHDVVIFPNVADGTNYRIEWRQDDLTDGFPYYWKFELRD